MDEYTVRDDQGLMVLDGDRSGIERRLPTERRNDNIVNDVVSYNKRKPAERRFAFDRRDGYLLTFKDILFDQASSIFLGLVIMFSGIFLLITGVTFLPIIGIYAGIFMLITGCGFIITSGSKELK